MKWAGASKGGGGQSSTAELCVPEIPWPTLSTITSAHEDIDTISPKKLQFSSNPFVYKDTGECGQ